MRQVVVTQDRIDRLNRFLKREDIKGECFYIFVDLDCINVAELLRQKGFKKISINDGLGDIDFRKEYIEFIGRLNRDYDSIYWWANSVSYKGTFVSDLCQEVFNYYCIMSLIKRYDCNFIIISEDIILNNSIKKYCGENKIKCRLLDISEKKNSIVHFRRCLISSIYFLFDNWRRKIWVSIYLSKNIKKTIERGKSYYIIRSWIQKRSFFKADKYVDVFFGRLPEYLKQKGIEFIILGGILNDYKNLISRIKRTKDFLIVPQEYFIGYLDYIRVIIRNLVNRPSLKKPIMFHHLDVTNLVMACLERDYEHGEVNKNLIYFYYIKRLLEKVRVSNFLFTFEGHAWERMCIFALRKYSHATKIIGYAHASITKNGLGYFYSKKEENIAPLPDKIVTVGKEPRLILEMDGNYLNRVELKEGCALRYEYLFNKSRIERSENENILVGFSIDMNYSLKLLKFLYGALGDNGKYKVVLRSHPFTPIEVITKSRNIRLCNNFTISKNIRFEEDLKDAGVLIYIDTTSSIEALICGVPVIHIDFKEPSNSDPLFKLNSLKWTVSEGGELRDTIDYIYSMKKEEYFKKYEEAVGYLKNYFYPVEEKYLKEFII